MEQTLSKPEMKEIVESYLLAYFKTIKTQGMTCIDVEGFAVDYLGLKIENENIAELDRNRMGFLSDGETPLLIYKNKKVVPVVYPENTIVLDNYLSRIDKSAKRRFTLAHEVAHYMLKKLGYSRKKAFFCNEYDNERNYSKDELHELFNMDEISSDEMGSYIIMPEFLVADNVCAKFENGRVPIYGRNVVEQETKAKLYEIANQIGVSYSALLIQIKKYKMVEKHSMEEFISNTNIKVGVQ